MQAFKRQFSAADVMRLWYSTKTNEEIKQELGCSKSQLYTLAARLKLPNRGRFDVATGKRRTKDEDSITEDVIRHRVAKIQACWTPREMERRAVGGQGSTEVKNYVYCGGISAFAECGLP